MSDINQALINLLKRYTPTPISPCRVCGGPRSLASVGDGDAPTVACDHTRKPDGTMDWDHYQRSRGKHLGTGDSEVVELIDAYNALGADVQAQAMEYRSERGIADVAAQIIRDLISSIEKHGNFSEESTLDYLRQALGCISRFEPPPPPQTPCRHEFTDNGEFEVSCSLCNLHIDATPSRSVLEYARQIAGMACGNANGHYSLDAEDLDEVVSQAAAMAIVEYASRQLAPAEPQHLLHNHIHGEERE